jgi:hypothetical protein
MPQNVINLETGPHGIPVTDATGSALTSAILGDGQLIIGSTDGILVPATLTAGSNVTIVNGPGTVTINATGGTGPGFSGINIETFTSSGTYTPPANLAFIVLEAVGGGGAGGGAGTETAFSTTHSIGGGGASGGYARVELSAAQVGASATVTIGAGGVGAITTGPQGGSTSFVCTAGTFSCPGGFGGIRNQRIAGQPMGAQGGLVSTGFAGSWDRTFAGQPGGVGFSWSAGSPNRLVQACTGAGGESYFGGGGTYDVIWERTVGDITRTGHAGPTAGSGGSGAFVGSNGNVSVLGGNGAPGIVIITEYLLP